MLFSNTNPVDAVAPNPVEALQVLIVDDQTSVSDGLVRLLASHEDAWGVIRCAATLAEARSCIQGRHPDIVVLDVDLAGEDGLTLLPELTPRARVLVLTSQTDEATRERATRMGAAAVLDKIDSAANLMAALRRLVTPQLGGEFSPIRAGT